MVAICLIGKRCLHKLIERNERIFLFFIIFCILTTSERVDFSNNVNIRKIYLSYLLLHSLLVWINYMKYVIVVLCVLKIEFPQYFFALLKTISEPHSTGLLSKFKFKFPVCNITLNNSISTSGVYSITLSIRRRRRWPNRGTEVIRCMQCVQFPDNFLHKLIFISLFSCTIVKCLALFYEFK